MDTSAPVTWMARERAAEPLAASTPGSVVTYDRRMLETARVEGLSAHAPGMTD